MPCPRHTDLSSVKTSREARERERGAPSHAGRRPELWSGKAGRASPAIAGLSKPGPIVGLVLVAGVGRGSWGRTAKGGGAWDWLDVRLGVGGAVRFGAVAPEVAEGGWYKLGLLEGLNLGFFRRGHFAWRCVDG